MAGEKWTVYWNEYSADTYLYGSEIIYNGKDDVSFKNLLMPPGTIIKQWYSRTNFQMKKIEPALPMIDGECDYQITVNIDHATDACCLIRLIFYDRYEAEVGSIMVRDKTMAFRCPLTTYSYRMQLINGGLTTFRFHSIVIREILHGTDEKITPTE